MKIIRSNPRSATSLLCLVIAFGLAAAAPSSAAEHIAGIRISQTGQVDTTIEVDVTVLYTIDATSLSEANLGFRAAGELIPALIWGDGDILSETAIPLVATSTVFEGTPVRLYRGSFSHTYGAFVGNRNIRAATEAPGDLLLTGTMGYSYFYDVPADALPSINPSHTIVIPLLRNNVDVMPTIPFFADGFESGDASGWSKTVSGQ